MAFHNEFQNTTLQELKNNAFSTSKFFFPTLEFRIFFDKFEVDSKIMWFLAIFSSSKWFKKQTTIALSITHEEKESDENNSKFENRN